MKRHFYAFLFFTCITIASYGQLTSCTQTLRLARSTYEQGRLDEIPELLQRCLQGGFSTEERAEAYKLLCLAYIYLDEPRMADEAMLNLLRTNNYFEVKPESDPAEFVALYRTFRTEPIYRLGIVAGANVTRPNVVDYLPSNALVSEYRQALSFQGGLAADIPTAALRGRFTIHPELLLVIKSFTYSNKGTLTDVTPEGQPFSRKVETTGLEKHLGVSVPLMAQYRLSDSRVRPYIALGMSFDYLINATNRFRRTKEDATSLDEQTIKLTDSRNTYGMNGIAAVGMKMKVTGGFAVAELRYSHGFTQANTADGIYANFDRTIPTGGYVDGIFKMNTLSLTVGYLYNRFNPKKIRK